MSALTHPRIRRGLVALAATVFVAAAALVAVMFPKAASAAQLPAGPPPTTTTSHAAGSPRTRPRILIVAEGGQKVRSCVGGQ